jgi:hypothetical protein
MVQLSSLSGIGSVATRQRCTFTDVGMARRLQRTGARACREANATRFPTSGSCSGKRPRVEEMPFLACPAERTPRSNRSMLLDLFLARNAC